MPLTDKERTVPEQTTPLYTATLVDESDVAIPLSSISTIALTYYDRRTGSIINSRNSQNVKNANNVTIHATSGLLTWELQVADTTFVTPASFSEDETEEHVALFEWTLSNGRRGKFTTRFFVTQIVKVT